MNRSVILFCALLASAAVPLSAADVADRSPAAGWIVFDSRRDGQFDIYKMRPDGSSVTRLTDSPDWETAPDWSPDGREIVYTRRDNGEDEAVGGIWIMDADGSHQRMLVRHGTAPRFSADGRHVVFERDRVELRVWSVRERRQERLVPPPDDPPYRHLMIKPHLSADGETVAFVSDKGGRWHTWAMDLDGRETLIGEGCQPAWHPDGKSVFFIMQRAYQDLAIGVYPWPSGPAREHLSLTGTWRHVYFPSVSDDGRHLLFAACPSHDHDHAAANYQIFIQELPNGKPVRLSNNDFTERWPRLSTTAR